MTTNHPKIVELKRLLGTADAAIAEYRKAREEVTAAFAKLENDQAAILEQLARVRKQLTEARKRGQALDADRDAILKAIREMEATIDGKLGQVEVALEVRAPQGGNTPTDIDIRKGKARDLAKEFRMSVPEVIEAAGGVIKWDDLSVSFGG